MDDLGFTPHVGENLGFQPAQDDLGFSPSKPPEGGFLGNTVGAGISAFGHGLDTIAGGVALGAGALAESAGQAFAGKFGYGDKAFAEADKYAHGTGDSFTGQAQALNRQLGTTPGETGEKVANLVGNIGSLAVGALPAIAGMAAQSAGHAQDLMEHYNIDETTARRIAQVSFIANAGAGAVFPMGATAALEKAGLSKVLGGLSPYVASGGANAAQGAVARAGEKSYLENKGYDQAAKDLPGAGDIESLVTDFAFGVGAHHFLADHPGKTNKPIKDPTISDVQSDLAKGVGPDPSLTDVDTSGQRSQFGTLRNTEMPDATFRGHQADVEAQNAGITAPETEGLKRSTSGSGSPLLPTDAKVNKVTSKQRSSPGTTPDVFTIQHVDEALERARNAVDIETTKMGGNDTHPDGTPLSPEDQKLYNEQRIAGIDPKNGDGLNSSHVDRFWNGIDSGSKRLESQVVWGAGGWGKMDPIKALKWMQQYSAPHIQEIASKLLKYPELIGNVRIRIMPAEKFNGAINEGGTAGVYSQVTHDVHLGVLHGLYDSVIAHELVHAATSRGLTVGEAAPEKFPKLAKLAASLQRGLDLMHQAGNVQVEKVVNPRTGKAEAQLSHDFSDSFPKVGRGRVYGLTNTHEMVTEGFTNPNFRTLLRKFGAWDNVKQAISKVLGLNDHTALDKLLNISSEVMEESSKNRLAISKELERVQSDLGGKQAVLVLKSEARDSVDEAISKGLDKDPQQKNPVKDIPGLGHMNKLYIPDAPSTDKILAGLKAVKDIAGDLGTRVTKNFTVSGEQLANLWRQPGLYDFGRIFDRAQKLGHFYEETVGKQLIREIKKTIPDANWKSLEKIMKIQQAEDSYKDKFNPDGKRLTPEQLTARLNPAEQRVYHLLRSAHDAAFNHVNKTLTESGQEPIPRRAAYAASVRSGPWSMEIHRPTRDGSQMIGFIRGHSIADVNRGVAAALKEYPDAFAKTKTAVFNKQFNGKEDNLFQHLGLAERTFGKEHPVTMEIRKAIEDAAQRSGENAADYKKRLMDKTGVRYAEGDRPWLSAKKNVQDWYKAQTEVVTKAYKWSEMQKAVEQAKKVMSDPELASSHPNMAAYLKEYTRAQLGFGKNEHVSAIENKVAETVGMFIDKIPGLRNLPVDMHASMVAMRAAKALLYLKALGFYKPQHFLVNGVFQPMFTMARHMKMSALGLSHDPFKTLSDGLYNGNSVLLNHYTNGIHKLNDFQEKIATYIKSNNIATNNPFQDLGDIGSSGMSKAGQGVLKVGGFMMQEGERFARVNAFTSYASHLEQSGKFGDLSKHENLMELFREAERQTTETMGSFRHTDRPQAFVKMGQLGTGLATLQQFKINFLNQFHDYIKFAIETKNFAPLLAFSATQIMMAGVMGMIGFAELDTIWKTFRDLIPSRYVDREFATFSPKEWCIKHMNPMLARGPVSTLTGINFASSLDAGSIVEPSVSGMLPFLSELRNTFEPPLQYLAEPTQDNLHKLIWNETPYGSRGILETGKFMGKDVPGGNTMRSWYNSPSGVSQSPNNPGEGTYTRDDKDTFIRSAGFTSTQEAQLKDTYYMNKEDNKVLQDRQKTQIDRLDSAVRNGNIEDAGDAIQSYLKLEGDPVRALANEHFQKLVMDWNTDYEQRMALGVKSDSLESIYKYQRLHEMIDNIKQYYGKK